MKKVIITLAIVLCSFGNAIAQGRQGWLGADIDSLKYIIASPWKNWYVSAGAGVQTYIGNELDASARHNTCDFKIYGEIGKWIIPDVAVSLNADFFTVHGQSKYVRQPWREGPADALGYQKFNAYAFGLTGYVTIDWTNLVQGFERGAHRHFHVMTPLGLGGAVMFNSQKYDYPKEGDHKTGDNRFNFEMVFTPSLLLQYNFTRALAVDARIGVTGTRESFDFSPYDDKVSIVDWMPFATVGVRFNLLEYETRKRLEQLRSSGADMTRISVASDFYSIGTLENIEMMQEDVVSLQALVDSLRIEVPKQNEEQRRVMQGQLDSLNMLLRQTEHALTSATDQLKKATKTIVYFKLDKYDLDYNATKLLDRFIEEAAGDNREYYVIGSADSITGNVPHNQELSENRCKAVINYLTKHGFKANRITKKALGGVMESKPYELNRMCLIIPKNETTERLLER